MEMEPVDALVSKGLSAYQDGNYPKALAAFEQALKLAPDDHAVREAAANTANRAQEWESAARHWLEISKLNPRRAVPVNYYLAALRNARRFPEARAYCETAEFLQLKANRSRYYAVLTMVNLSEGKIDEAKDLAAKGFAHSPTDTVALEFATLFFDHKLYAEMEGWLAKFSAPKLYHEAINTLQARALYAQKLWDKATTAWQKVLVQAVGPQADTARLYLARIAANNDKHEEAQKHYDLLLQKQPQHEEAISYRIRMQMLNNENTSARALIDAHWEVLGPINRVQYKARSFTSTNPEAGVQVYLDALKAQPENFALKLAYASYLLDLKNFEAAEEKIVAYLRVQPKHAKLNQLYLRLMQVKPGSEDQQLKQAELTLALNPSNMALLNTVGRLLARNSRRAEAVQHYQTAVKIAPSEAILWRNGTYHLAMDNRLDEAAAFADEAIKTLGTSSLEQLNNAAWILRAAKKTKPALEFAHQAVALNPRSASAHEMVANLQMDKGRFDLAWAHIQKIDALVLSRRSERIAHMAAQCMAAFCAVSGSSSPPVKGLFPERLFHAIVKRAMPDLSGRRSGIVHCSSSLGAGGAERQVAYVMQGLTQELRGGERCSLVVNSLNPQLGNDFFLPEFERSDCDIIDLDGLRQGAAIRQTLADFPEHASRIRQLATLPRETSRIAIPFFAYLVNTRPRVVHLWQDAVNIAAGMAAVAAGVPQIVLCTRSTRPRKIFRFRRYLPEGYKALLTYRGALSIVNNSDNGAKDYEAWLGLPSGTIRPFYNGYDFETMRAKTTPSDRLNIRQRCAIPEGAKVIGGVMRFTHEKRPDLWIEALIVATRQSPDIYGLIVGDGPMQGAMIAKVKAAGLGKRIHFAGRQTPVEPWMKAMDILFLSSATEGLPNVLIEAQALGVPVASMNVGGAPEALLAGKTGIILEEAAPEVLAQKLTTLLHDIARMEAMSVAAPHYVDATFSLASMVDRLKGLYQPH